MIDGVVMVSDFGANIVQNLDFIVTFNAFQTYEFEVHWRENTFGAQLALRWEDAGNMVLIPPENFMISHDISNGPYQIIIGCEDGYRQISDPTDRWELIPWGDGIIDSNEVWDDGNTISGDGWTSDCTSVEEFYICETLTSIPNSVWSKWDTGYEPSGDKSKWVEAGNTRESIFLSALLLLMIVSNTILKLIMEGSPKPSVFTALNQLQLLLILPQIGAFIPVKIILTIVNAGIPLFSFNFGNFKIFPSISYFDDNFR